jgi:hypothetical protein
MQENMKLKNKTNHVIYEWQKSINEPQVRMNKINQSTTSTAD